MSTAIRYRSHDLELLAPLEERHFWFRARRRIIVDSLRRWFPDTQRYLEIGSGTGYVLRGIREAFPHWSVVASDPLAEDQGVLRVDIRPSRFTSEFDTVGVYDVLEHIEDDRAALVQLRNACRPAGGVLLTVPQHPLLWSTADTYAQHCRRYRRDDLLAKLRISGFDILGHTSFHTLNLPLFYLRSRFLRSTGRNPVAALPPSPLNWLLEQSMEFDRLLIRAGARLPWGVSLLVAARRRD